MSPPDSQLLALLRAVKAQPEDDAPRLILADYLEEHGDANRATRRGRRPLGEDVVDRLLRDGRLGGSSGRRGDERGDRDESDRRHHGRILPEPAAVEARPAVT